MVTGGANGIGAAIVQGYARLNANIVIADLPSAASSANKIINAIVGSGRAIFVSVDITDWSSMVDLFKTAKSEFGRVDIVVANAGIMETKPFFDFDLDPSTGDLKDEPGLGRVIDVNLKGTMNSKYSIPCTMTRGPARAYLCGRGEHNSKTLRNLLD